MNGYGTQKRTNPGFGNGPIVPDVEKPTRGRFRPLPDDPLPPSSTEGKPGTNGALVDEVLVITTQAYRGKARTTQTRQAYRRDMEHFAAWCKANCFTSLPASPETVAYYLAAFGDQTPGGGGLAIATLERRLVGIAHAHKAYYSNMPEAKKVESPTAATSVREVLQGIRREAAARGLGKPKQAAPLLIADVRKIIGAIDTNRLIGKRDKALLLMEWSGAFRSGEIGTVHVSDLLETEDGILITLQKSKTDQVGEGTEIGILSGTNPDTCPVVAIKEWLAASGIAEGPVIRYVNKGGKPGTLGLSRQKISKIVKKLVASAGLDPAKYSGHSLRAGVATQMILAGMTEAEAMAHGRWKSPRVFRRYVRLKKAFKNSPVRLVGL